MTQNKKGSFFLTFIFAHTSLPDLFSTNLTFSQARCGWAGMFRHRGFNIFMIFCSQYCLSFKFCLLKLGSSSFHLWLLICEKDRDKELSRWLLHSKSSGWNWRKCLNNKWLVKAKADVAGQIRGRRRAWRRIISRPILAPFFGSESLF